MSRALFIGIGIAVVALIIILVLLFLPEAPNGPITCTSDEQCGGAIISQTFCRDGNLYGSGQQNICMNPGKDTSKCETSYADMLLETCDNGCEGSACL